jgi:lipid-A-disaccharide synthase
MSKKIFISAGEASGEHYGALLAEELTRQLAATGQRAAFFGMGGERMAAAGLDCVVRSEEMAVMGLTEIVRHLPRIWREFRRLKQAVRERRPAVAVLIDFPEIHFRLAKLLHELGIPVIFFVSPQLWAWKKKRIRLVQKYIDKMLVIFPFEEPFYRERGVEAEFVGHPLAELPLPAISRADFAAANGLDPAKTWIGLLPGSRAKEIGDILPELLRAARELAMQNQAAENLNPDKVLYQGTTSVVPQAAENQEGALAPEGMQLAGDFEFIVPLAPTLYAEQRAEVRRLVAEYGAGLPVHLVNDARATLALACSSVVASGTATVEAALIGNPFVVVYRVSPVTFAIAKRLVKVPFVAMANLIAGKLVVPELIQGDFTAENIVQQIRPLLPDGLARQSMMEELARIHAQLRKDPETSGAIERVAEVTLETMGQSVRD